MKPMVWVMARIAWTAPARYVWGALLWVVSGAVPLASGLLLQQIFNRISGDAIVSLAHPLWLSAALVGVELMRGVIFVSAWVYGDYWWHAAAVTLRANALRSILTARGPAASRLPHSSGESIGRFRDDVDDLVGITDNSVPLFGATVFAIGALAIMLTINPLITLVLILPMVAIGVVSRLMGGMVRRLHARARVLGSAVTAHVGDMFTGVLALKTAGAEEAALQRLRQRNRERRGAAVKDRLATDLLDTATGATVEISIGLVLLLAAPAMRRGEFTVGDLALFTSYVGRLTELPSVVGEVLYRLPQAEVAVARLRRLLAPYENADDLTRNTGVWLKQEPPPAVSTSLDGCLEVVEARGLTVRHADGGRGVSAVDLRLSRGSFTVVTGAVGSGKTTLVRALLGLVPTDAGTISWNGVAVADPGTFLVPGRAAYAGQVPRLFSESLRENLLLGWSDVDLQRALWLAVFDRDLAAMPAGLETVVGSRGVRLSGGQVQRATAARALVRSPELLVVDDLSSALDVETEKLLWDRISGGATTLLVVSHRRAALERADQIVVLDRGRVAGCGPLPELLENCPEMRRLWSEELVVQAEEEADFPRPVGG